jgi:hypothetical protein
MTDQLNTGTTDTAPAAAPTTPAATVADSASQSTATPETPTVVTPEAAPAPQSTAPDKYNFNLPEGTPQESVADFAKVAKDLGLSQEAAQKVVDLQISQAAKQSATWADAAKVDAEFGGDKLAENLAVAKKAVEAYGSPELKTFLDKTGLGNNPEVIRFFYRAGKALSEDRVVQGGNSTTPGPRSPATALYPNQPSA